MRMRFEEEMLSWLLPRRPSRVLYYFILFLTLYIAYRLLFKREMTTTNPELPELIIQRGNDHYFKRNAHLSPTIFQKKAYEWKKAKRKVGASSNDFGKLNVHIWGEICGEDLKSLRNYVLFPQFPSRRFYTRTTLFSHGESNKDFGERIFGFLHPKKTGLYNFRTRGSSIEVWMSENANPQLSKLVVKNNSPKKEHVFFDLDMVVGRKCYMEILHKKGDRKHGFELMWKTPGSSQYTELSGTDISAMLDDGRLGRGEVDIDDPIIEIQSIHKKDNFPLIRNSEQGRANLHQLPFIQDVIWESVLPSCEYEPSYLVDYAVTNYKGVWETHYNSLYPIDKTNVTRDGWVCLGNDVLEEKKAVGIVKQFMNAINKGTTRQHKLKRILSVEDNHDEIKGDRYLLELELQKVKNGQALDKSYRLSTFVYKSKGSASLCIPRGYQWNKTATVNIILTVGGRQGRWVQHFINNLVEIYRETKDKNFNVVIMDFHSKDIDIQASLEKSGLPRYILLNMKSKFHKTIGLQYAMNVVTDPNDIVFVCDLHLYLPVTIIDQIRKHCIQGKTAFNPLLIRLDCGFTANNPHGRWEHDGYGPIATFKSDWNRFGGMNVEKFKHSWGGEDWEMVDRIVSSGYEIERLKIMNFVHFYHTKKGMWHEAEQ